MDRFSLEKRLFQKLERPVIFPANEKKLNITSIVIRDEYEQEDNKSNLAKVTAGGIGYSYAHFHLESEYNVGFDFLITIYGVVKGEIFTTTIKEEDEEEEFFRR